MQPPPVRWRNNVESVERPEGSLPLALGRQIAHDGPCMQLGAGFGYVLRDPGRHNPPLTSLEHDLATLHPSRLCTKRVPGWCPSVWRAGQKITQPNAAGQEFRGSAAEPLRKCPIYKPEAP